jgi:hypothetical protein
MCTVLLGADSLRLAIHPQTTSAGVFTIPQEPTRRPIHGIESFNVLRGGEYFFVPSITALNWLADLRA